MRFAAKAARAAYGHFTAFVLPLALAFWLVTPASRAATFEGRVIAVQNGDTVVVRDPDKLHEKVRLIGIDAPELNQPFGAQARENLARMILRKVVQVEWSDRDQYGRILGKVLFKATCAPGETCPRMLQDAGLEQIRAGLAWWYRDYEEDQTEEDRAVYEDWEHDARRSGLGLWADPGRIPPWEWRKPRRLQQRPGHAP